MKKLPLLVALLLSGGWALAQSNCPTPVLKVYQDNQEVNVEGSAMPASVKLVLTASPDCAPATAYQLTGAEVTLLRGKRPILPTRKFDKPEMDLTDFKKVYQPGDRLFVSVPASGVTMTSGGGKQEKYPATGASAFQVNWRLN
jgi:hypothetical protein